MLRAISRLAVLTLTATLSSWATAQQQFSETLLKQHLPFDKVGGGSVAIGDVDGNGAPDVVVGNTIGRNRLYLNDGGGRFVDATAAFLPVDNDTTTAVLLVDVNGDGALDLVTANGIGTGAQNRLYLNNGAGRFTDVTRSNFPSELDKTSALAAADVDRDGDADLVFGHGRFGQTRLYLNDGTGKFADATATHLPQQLVNTRAVAAGDVDGDGDLDLFLGNTGDSFGAQNFLYLNDGSGRFTDGTASGLPARADPTFHALLADVDGDGDLDVVASSAIFVNDGTGTFAVVVTTWSPRALADIDGDGDVDLIAATGSYFAPKRLYLNNGAGSFTDATGFGLPDVDPVVAVAFADVDGDLDLDFVTTGYDSSRLYLNEGASRFIDATAPRMVADSGATLSMALGDIDGDGALDLLLGKAGQNRMFRNDGSGRFLDATDRLPFDQDGTWALALADVDGDRDLDLVLGNQRAQNRLYTNDGSGPFADATAQQMPAGTHDTKALAFGDVDGDGDLDLVLGNGNGSNAPQNLLYLNDGRGTFTDATAARMPVDADQTWAVLLHDLDGDGDLDLVFGNDGQRARLHLNDGHGFFTDATAARLPPDTANTHSLATGDIDGDGDPDLVLGTLEFQGFARLYLNHGNATFANVTSRRPPIGSGTVRLADVDEDGDPDLVVGAYDRSRLYLNDGSGVFLDVTDPRMPGGEQRNAAIALGDLDGDGDVDLAAGGDTRTRLYTNLHRHVATPFLARLGDPFVFEFQAEPGYAATDRWAWPLLGRLATQPITLPGFGAFYLDPLGLVPLPAVLLPRPAGVGRRELIVPPLQHLVGGRFHAQALIVSPSGARFTNYTADVVLR